MKSCINKVVGVLAVAALVLGVVSCANDLPETPTEHEHTFASQWSKNSTEHWHAATCEHNDQVKDKAAHNFGEYVPNGDATTQADGTKTRKCSECFYEDTVTDEGSKLTSHNWDAGLITKASTVSSFGEKHLPVLMLAVEKK
ncbi:MAG: hypothetical protein MJ176_04260 [Treponema sp.]|nr:hypothetical protein [Treponema sp.]